MKITDHIYFYQNPEGSFIESCSSVVIVSDKKQVMIDPGTNIKKRLDYLIKEMKSDDLDINETDEIWLTHAHPDHYQAISDLFKRFGEERLVRCHPLGQPILNNPNWRENFITQEKRNAGPYWKLLISLKDRKKIDSASWESVLSMIKKGILMLRQKITNIEPFFDTETISLSPVDVQILFLPGHTADEVGFWIAKERVLILGDLIHIRQDRDKKLNCRLILYNFHADINQALTSIKRMKHIKEPEILLTVHSEPLKGEDKIQQIFDELIEKIDTYKNMGCEFVQKHPKLVGIQLVKKLAKALPKNNLLEIEKRFIAFTVLKSLGEV